MNFLFFTMRAWNHHSSCYEIWDPLWGSVIEKSLENSIYSGLNYNVLTLFGTCETNYTFWSAYSFWDGAAYYHDCQYTHKQKRISLPIKYFKYTIYSLECKMPQNNVDRQSSLNSLLIRGHRIWICFLNNIQERKWKTD